MSEGIIERCGRCGAALEISPDSVVVVCSYCGWASVVGGGEARVLVLESASLEALRGLTESFIRSKAGRDARLRDLSFLMVPIWVAELDASTRYNGYVEETRTRHVGVGRSSRVESYRIYKPIRGEIKERVAVAIYGRRFESLFGLAQVKASALGRYGAARQLDAASLKGWMAISSELGEDEVIEAAKTRVAEEHRRRVESMTTKIFDCYTSAKALSTKLIIYPVVEAKYEHDERSYRLCIDGVKNSPKVLTAEVPLTMRTRIKRALLTVFGVLGAVMAGILLQPIATAEALPDEVRLAAIAAPPLGGLVIGLVGAYLATVIQRVVRAHTERDMITLSG